METQSLPYYTTDKGLLVNLSTNRPEKHLVNDAALVATFHPRWWLVDDQQELTSYSVHAGTRRINQRYELVNTSVQGTPQTIPAEEIEKDCNYEWIGKFAGLQSLYRFESDEEDLGFQPQQFEPKKLGSLIMDSLGDPTQFSYKMHGTGFRGEAEKSSSDLGYQDIFRDYEWVVEKIHVDEIAKAMTPDVAWHLYPCSVTSVLAYRIIRSWVKDHIDPLYAVVTSDYDFCFTVEKKIRTVPFVKKIERLTSRWKSYTPPRFTSSTVEYEKRKVFEMTNAKDKYSGYPIVDGFKGESLADLARNIDAYLHDLMAVINAPLTKCQHCDGLGFGDYYKLPTNERDALRMKVPAA